MSIMFEPVNIRNLKIRNRIARSATFEGMGSAEGEPSERLARLYTELAEAEVGLIFTSAAMVERFKLQLPAGEDIAYPLFIDRDELVESWKPIVAAVQSRGATIAMQIVHPGRQEDPGLRLGDPPLAPSPVELPGSGVVPREMTVQEIREMVENFAQACRRVKEAGFDAVQLHGGHGYMISNFISPYTNRRTDEYGGDTEGRARFIVDIIRRAREFVGHDFPIMIKMNCDDFVPGGLVREESVRVASLIEEGGIDCIEVTGRHPRYRGADAREGNQQAGEGGLSAFLRGGSQTCAPHPADPGRWNALSEGDREDSVRRHGRHGLHFQAIHPRAPVPRALEGRGPQKGQLRLVQQVRRQRVRQAAALLRGGDEEAKSSLTARQAWSMATLRKQARSSPWSPPNSRSPNHT